MAPTNQVPIQHSHTLRPCHSAPCTSPGAGQDHGCPDDSALSVSDAEMEDAAPEDLTPGRALARLRAMKGSLPDSTVKAVARALMRAKAGTLTAANANDAIEKLGEAVIMGDLDIGAGADISVVLGTHANPTGTAAPPPGAAAAVAGGAAKGNTVPPLGVTDAAAGHLGTAAVGALTKESATPLQGEPGSATWDGLGGDTCPASRQQAPPAINVKVKGAAPYVADPQRPDSTPDAEPTNTSLLPSPLRTEEDHNVQRTLSFEGMERFYGGVYAPEGYLSFRKHTDGVTINPAFNGYTAAMGQLVHVTGSSFPNGLRIEAAPLKNETPEAFRERVSPVGAAPGVEMDRRGSCRQGKCADMRRNVYTTPTAKECKIPLPHHPGTPPLLTPVKIPQTHTAPTHTDHKTRLPPNPAMPQLLKGFTEAAGHLRAKELVAMARKDKSLFKVSAETLLDSKGVLSGSAIITSTDPAIMF